MSDITLIGDSLSELYEVKDIYTDGIGDVELVGDGHNVRLVYYTLVRGEPLIVAKLVMPVALAGEHVIKLLAAKRHIQDSASTVQ